jgi:allophanate hydrolase
VTIPASLEIETLHAAYAAGTITPHAVLDAAYERIEARGRAPIWIDLVPPERAAAFLRDAETRRSAGATLPLFGIPFAIKDNIDLAGVPTTAGCPAFRYVPEANATAVARLIAAGAVPVGKTNLDQFATGLVGTRSPFGAGTSAFDERYVSGGSSSGSALAVAHGLVSFSLGTDTAGSGRVPAAFNNLVGLKPTRGLVSTRGVVPACRSLDCVSVFAGSASDAAAVLDAMSGFDASDPFSREPAESSAGAILRVGVADTLEPFAAPGYERLYQASIERLESLGVTVKRVSFEPFLAAARLLYGGPWVAERYAAVGAFIDAHRDDVNPVVRDIVLAARGIPGADVFSATYTLAELRRQAEVTFRDVDALLMPTTDSHPTLAAVAENPVEENARLGRYTNFVNLLDLAGVAVPAGFTEHELPFGITLVGPAFSDRHLLALGDRLHRVIEPTFGATGAPVRATPLGAEAHAKSEILLAVAGAHLSGQPLNHELTNRGARLLRTTRTAASYRLYALAGTVPPKPGLVRAPDFSGPGIEVEVWALAPAAFGSFVSGVPAPMVIGTTVLADGTSVKGFSCEPYSVAGSAEITDFGGWRAYLASR